MTNQIAVLREFGLEPVGNWRLSAMHDSTHHLKHLPGIAFDLLIPKERQTNVVYAFVGSDEVFYVGETSIGMKKRFEGYRYGNPKKSDTDNRVKLRITGCLQNSDTVAIWCMQPVAIIKLPNGEHCIPVSKPVEELLISELKPKLNEKNLRKQNSSR